MLYESVGRLRELPDSTLVYPAHGAGSLCGKSLSRETVSTIGEQKRVNYAMQPMSFEKFRELVTAEQPEAPGYFVYDAVLNRQERPDLSASLQTSLRPLSLSEVLKLHQSGAQMLDVRAAVDFEAASLSGSLNIALRGSYATWCGSLLSHDRPIVVLAEAGSEEEAVMRLGRIGFDNVVGFLEGSLNIPLNHLQERLSEVPFDRPVVLHCEGGYRSAIACSLLAQTGRSNFQDLVGGIKAWIATSLPTDPPDTLMCGTKICSVTTTG